MDEREGLDEQGRVLLPRTGVARGRHGARDRGGLSRGARGVPDRIRGDRARSRGALLRDAARAARRHGGAAAGARGDEPRDPRRDARSRARARRRRRTLGRRVRGARGGRLARDRGGDRARARARSRDGRGGPAAPRRDGRDPRARGRGGREALPADRGRVAGELQLPGPDRGLGRARGGRGVLRRGREPRRPTSRDAQGLGRVPQPARRESRGPAAAGARAREVRTSRSRRSCRR